MSSCGHGVAHACCAGDVHCPCPCAPPVPENQSVVVVVCVCVSVSGDCGCGEERGRGKCMCVERGARGGIACRTCVCEVRNGPPSCVNFGPDKPHAGHPGQPSVACRCQHVAHTKLGKTHFEKSNLLWLECPRPSVGRHCLRSSCRTFRTREGEEGKARRG